MKTGSNAQPAELSHPLDITAEFASGGPRSVACANEVIASTQPMPDHHALRSIA